MIEFLRDLQKLRKLSKFEQLTYLLSIERFTSSQKIKYIVFGFLNVFDLFSGLTRRLL